jgi:hypothetical protein
VITLYNAAFFQLADTPQARRRRDANTLGKFNIGHAAIILQLAQNFHVDCIKFQSDWQVHPHGSAASIGLQNAVSRLAELVSGFGSGTKGVILAFPPGMSRCQTLQKGKRLHQELELWR